MYSVHCIYINIYIYIYIYIYIHYTVHCTLYCTVYSIYTKLYVRIVLSMYAYATFTVVSPKYCIQYMLRTILPDDSRTINHLLLLSNVDYIHVCYHYNVFFLNLVLFVYLFVLLYLLDARCASHINFYRFH